MTTTTRDGDWASDGAPPPPRRPDSRLREDSSLLPKNLTPWMMFSPVREWVVRPVVTLRCERIALLDDG